jgi:hypothetical protein
MNFEQFEAGMRDARLMEVHEGYLTIQGRLFFNPSLKSRRKVWAFLDNTFPLYLTANCFSERGNYLCMAGEKDRAGVTILNPEYMGWFGSPFTALYENAKQDREEGFER